MDNDDTRKRNNGGLSEDEAEGHAYRGGLVDEADAETAGHSARYGGLAEDEVTEDDDSQGHSSSHKF